MVIYNITHCNIMDQDRLLSRIGSVLADSERKVPK